MLVGRRRKQTVVRSYTRQAAMQRDVEKMSNRGYQIEQQSGSFSSLQWLTPRWRKRKVVVTYRLAA